MTTCEPSELTLFESTSSPAASPARAPAPQANGPGSITPRPFCGERWPEPLASYSPDTCSWRTWRTSLQSETEPSGEKFSGTWPRSGSMSRGTVSQLRPSVPRTSVTGSSPLLPSPLARTQGGAEVSGAKAVLNLLPTPTAHERTHTPRQVDHGRQLANKIALLPTPTEQDGSNVEGKSQEARNTPPLNAMVRLLPTPTSNVMRSSGGSMTENQQWSAPGLNQILEMAHGILPREFETPDEIPGHSGEEFRSRGEPTSPPSADGKQSTGLRLSPLFVEWMIGAPTGWSDPDCPLSATEFKSSSGD